MFFAKSLTLVLAFGIVVGLFASAVRDARHVDAERLEVDALNDRFERLQEALESQILPDSELKTLQKQRKKAAKKSPPESRKRLFTLDFHGDIEASAVAELREEITALLQVLKKEDEVVVRIESEGGMVHAYGLAASQLKRLRDYGCTLTVTVDKVAASGGYLMACVADKILAAPFAIVGSIGVVAQIPNFHRVLKKHDVDVELVTAGEHKRTLTLFGENTDAARAKFKEELDDTHKLFKQFVTEHRPQVPIEKVATGEHWFGSRAVSLKLIDQLKTSDDYLLESAKDRDVFAVRFRRKKPLADRLHFSLMRLLGGARKNLQTESTTSPPPFLRFIR